MFRADDGCHIVAGAGGPVLFRNPLSQFDHGGCVFVIALWGFSGFLYDHELLQARFCFSFPAKCCAIALMACAKLESAEVTYETYYGLITRIDACVRWWRPLQSFSVPFGE